MAIQNAPGEDSDLTVGKRSLTEISAVRSCPTVGITKKHAYSNI